MGTQARNLAQLLNTDSTVATTDVADDSITAAKLANDIAISTTGSITVGGDIIKSTSGISNFAAGVNAGNSIASGGNYNVVVGDEAGTAITTGDSNIAIGFEALKTEDANSDNIAIGHQALKTQNAGSDAKNTAVGHLAGTCEQRWHRKGFLRGLNVF